MLVTQSWRFEVGDDFWLLMIEFRCWCRHLNVITICLTLTSKNGVRDPIGLNRHRHLIVRPGNTKNKIFLKTTLALPGYVKWFGIKVIDYMYADKNKISKFSIFRHMVIYMI